MRGIGRKTKLGFDFGLSFFGLLEPLFGIFQFAFNFDDSGFYFFQLLLVEFKLFFQQPLTIVVFYAGLGVNLHENAT